MLTFTSETGDAGSFCRSSLSLLLALAWLPVSPARAESYDQGPVFSLLEENDLFVNTDRHYTQGIKLSFLQRDGELPRWAQAFSDAFPARGFDLKVVKFGYQIGQSIYTPEDISLNTLIPDDRPYAGWLYTGFIWQRRGRTADRWPTLESFQADLGIIGPAALGREAQTWIHEVRGFQLPKGWSHQLHNEPGLALKYQRSLRFSAGAADRRWLDFLPHGGFSLGNVETSVRLGALLRCGWRLPDNFGHPNIHSLVTAEGGWSQTAHNPRFGVFAFTALEGRLVGYTSFLDGNLFHTSHHVEREPWVAELRTGVGMTLWRIEGGFALSYRTREFMKQTENNRYGSLFLSLRF